jgi:hypothetical protein
MPKFFPDEFNDFLLNDESKGITATFADPWDWTIGGITTKNSERLNERPKYAGATLGGEAKVLSVYLKNPEDRNRLVIAMDAGSNVQHRFYTKDELGKRWWVNAKATRLAYESHDPKTKIADFTFILDVDDPVYTSDEEFEDIWNVTLNGELHTVTIGGNNPTNPTYTITPGTPSGYYPFSYFMKCYNPVRAQQNEGIDITNGGWDTATLVTAGDMLANGDDVRVLVNGIEVPRWFGGGGMDSATTKIFIRNVWKPGTGGLVKLRTALDGVTTPARIEFTVNKTIKSILSTLPTASTFVLGTEEIAYRNLDAVACQATIVRRNIRGTSIAVHAVGSAVHWSELDVRIIWGNPAADAPTYDETFKPQFRLDTSSNILRIYDDTSGFSDTAGLRAGAFKRIPIDDGKGNLCRVYSEEHAGITVIDPAEVMGMEIGVYQKQGRTFPDTGELAWQYEHAATITNVESDGEKFKSFANTIWPNTPALGLELQSSPDSKIWTRKWNEAIPASANTWTAFTNNTAQAMPALTKFFRYHFKGSVNGVASNYIRGEINESIIQLTAAEVIQCGFIATQTNYQLVIAIVNTRTGETLYINYPAAEDEELVINTQDFEVDYKGLNAIMGIFWDSIRTRWLRMLPGDNELQFFSAFGTEMQIKTTYTNRAQ